MEHGLPRFQLRMIVDFQRAFELLFITLRQFRISSATKLKLFGLFKFGNFNLFRRDEKRTRFRPVL